MKIEKLLTRIALTAMVSLISGVSIAQEVVKLKSGMPYSKARKQLISSGWKPVVNKEQINNPKRSIIIDYFITKKKYTEIDDCAGTGLGLCLFKFQGKGKTLFVITANNGENQETVHGWRIEQTKTAPKNVSINCTPLNNTSRILASPNPNNIHPDWRGESYVGISWSFIGSDIIKNGTATYLKGDLYSPRGGIVNKNIFIIKNEWDCNSK